jgi:hypothetical protein
MIYSFQPYDQNANLADAYNKHCKIVPDDDDWIVLRDADFMMLTPKYENLMYEIVNQHTEYDLWTCYTNRVRCRPQLQKDLFNEPDIRKHRERALYLYKNNRYDVKEIKRVISGYFMMFKKKTWKRVGGFKGKGMFGVDTYFSRDILHDNGRIGLMEGVYGLHYYRFNEGVKFSPFKNKNK